MVGLIGRSDAWARSRQGALRALADRCRLPRRRDSSSQHARSWSASLPARFIALLASSASRDPRDAYSADLLLFGEGAVLPPSRFARFGNRAAVIAQRCRGVTLAYGTFDSSLPTRNRPLTLGVGVLLLFRAVSMLAPKAIRPLASVLGAPGARPAGRPVSSHARTRCGIHPAPPRPRARWMIGLSVITFVAVRSVRA